jgi:hypothetical protein
MNALLQAELDRQMEREINQACIEGMRRYRECELLELPHCFEYGDKCIFCGKTIEEVKL